MGKYRETFGNMGKHQKTWKKRKKEKKENMENIGNHNEKQGIIEKDGETCTDGETQGIM